MKIKNVSPRLKKRATNAACFGFGSAGLMHAAGMLLLLLTLCGCIAGLGNAIDNTSPDALDSGVVSVFDNPASPGNGIDNTSPNALDGNGVSVSDNPASPGNAVDNVSPNALDSAAVSADNQNQDSSAAIVSEVQTPDSTAAVMPEGLSLNAGVLPVIQYSDVLKNLTTTAMRKAAAKNFKANYNEAMARAAAQAPAVGIANVTTAAAPLFNPGGIPHYFGPYANWAYSPMPKGSIANVTLLSGGSGYTIPTVTITDAYNITGVTRAVATATVVSGVITKITLTSGGAGYTAPVVTINDSNTFATGADAKATIGGVFNGGIRKFVDSLPSVVQGEKNDLGQYIPAAIADKTTYPGYDYYEIAVVQYSEKMHRDLPNTTLRGYVQIQKAFGVPGGKNVFMRYPNGTAIMNRTSGTPVHVYAYDNPHYLGPIIVAIKGTPVRVKFHDYLPTGVNGNLFIPVDKTVMGAGMGPLGMAVPPGTDMNYTENRATIHLHGGDTVWISDGTPHQWITPAGEHTAYPKGVSVRSVPDMDNGIEPQGTMTFYYTNNQSARLMFYHDHAYGITRLNVYAGAAAPYLLIDQVELDLMSGTNVTGANPGLLKVLPDSLIPLVIQDKAFIDNTTINGQDPTWNWGTGPRVAGKITKAMTGDLWIPHVFMPNQNPYDLSGANTFGRWDYAPWFWPPAGDLVHGPIANPYYTGGPGTAAPWEPPVMPATPNPSMAMEAFLDTPVVNGAIYPNLTLEPKAYRFLILNAAGERYFNLQLYQSTPIIRNINVTAGGAGYTNPSVTITDRYGRGATAAATVVNGVVTGINVLTVGSNYTAPVVTIIGTNTTKATAVARVYKSNTEVGMVPAVATSGFPSGWPTDGRDGGVPDPAFMGPSFIRIGTEGGFLPAPVVVQNQPVTWIRDFLMFMFGIVDKHALELGPAERADVIIDFSAYANKTLILYNDAPAAFPNYDPRWDYYTGDSDQTDIGGAPTTQPGYGPNTRTIMQINVKSTPIASTYNLTNLTRVFAKGPGTKRGVFEVSQPTIIVPQAAYNSAYNKTFTANISKEYVQLYQQTHTFQNITGASLTIKLEPKAIHDEMGAAYEQDYGRMSSMLGLEVPNATTLTQNFMLLGYASPPVEVIKDSMVPLAPPAAGDGTQLWKIVHNGVDSHTYHFHLYNVQLVNRVGWDGVMVPPDADELGWKETVRVDPLEQTIVALRPVAPKLPFKVPNSTRLIDPTMPAGAILRGPPLGGFFDPAGNGVTVTNHLVNFGWEYVLHCHLLGHEEMDMMHAQAFAVAPEAPSNLTATNNGNSVNLTWKDNSISETGFTIQRATNASFTAGLTTFKVGPNVKTYTDNSVVKGTTYYYRIIANNVVGDTVVYAAPSIGFPTMSADSVASNVVKTAAIADGVGVWRNSNQRFYLDNNLDGIVDITVVFGATGDKPISADWDGDKKAGVGVWRNSNQRFYLDNNLDGIADKTLQLGATGDTPTSGDWDGDGKAGVGVWRNSNQRFYLDNNLDGIADITLQLGATGDTPISGDWDGDGKAGVGVWRNSIHRFYLDNNLDGIADKTVTLGITGDKPVIGDWDGDGKAGVGVYRDSNHMFYLDNNLDGVVDKTVTLGTTGDLPVAGHWG